MNSFKLINRKLLYYNHFYVYIKIQFSCYLLKDSADKSLFFDDTFFCKELRKFYR